MKKTTRSMVQIAAVVAVSCLGLAVLFLTGNMTSSVEWVAVSEIEDTTPVALAAELPEGEPVVSAKPAPSPRKSATPVKKTQVKKEVEAVASRETPETSLENASIDWEKRLKVADRLAQRGRGKDLENALTIYSDILNSDASQLHESALDHMTTLEARLMTSEN